MTVMILCMTMVMSLAGCKSKDTDNTPLTTSAPTQEAAATPAATATPEPTADATPAATDAPTAEPTAAKIKPIFEAHSGLVELSCIYKYLKTKIYNALLYNKM